MRKALVLIIVLLICTGMLASCTPQAELEPELSGTATLVFHNGVIHTMDNERRTTTAIAVENDVIVYVGDDEGVLEYIGPNTEVYDLQGKMVLPGFIDSHIHAASGWVVDMYQVNLFYVDPSEEAYASAIKEFADANPNQDVIIGQSFQVNAFDDNGPTKEALDAVDSERPIIVSDTSAHAYWTNSKAIEMAGITSATPDPEGGKIYKNAAGEPSGYFVDVFMFDEVLGLGEIGIEEYEAAYMNWQAESNSYGITAFSDVGLLGGTSISRTDRWEMIDRLSKSGELSLRANIAYMADVNDAGNETIAEMLQTMEEAQKYTSDYQTIATVKLFVDGVVEGRTGLLLEPYDAAAGTDPDYIGIPIWSVENLNKYVSAVDAAGYSMHMHTIADGSTRMGIDAIENAIETNGTVGSRHILTHITLIDPVDIPRMGNMGIIAAMQPTWFYLDPWFSQLEEQMLGTERFNRMYVIKDMLDADIIMTGSTDYNVLPDFRPLVGIECGTTQRSPYEGEDTDPSFTRNADQVATLMQMIEAYTINGAYQMGMEDKIGSLEVGKLADMAILEKDLFSIPLKDIAETNVTMTVIGGKIVFTKE